MQATAPPPAPHVGVIGLGQMGRGIARNLDRSGRLAAVWDLRLEAAQGLPPHVRVAPPAQMAALCDVVFLAVPGSREVELCLSGGESLLAQDRPGQIVVDLTTSYPSETRRIVAMARERGREPLDCGMTGGAAAADAGRITLMVGGAAATLERCRPVLEAFAGRIFHVGESGAGHTMKLVHNMICHAIFLVTSEGCRLAERAGLDLDTVVEVLNAGNARSFVSEARFPKHILSGTYDGRSRVANLAKDMAMAVDLARELGAPAAYGPLSADLLVRAMEADLADRDFTTLYREIDRLIAAQQERVEGGKSDGRTGPGSAAR